MPITIVTFSSRAMKFCGFRVNTFFLSNFLNNLFSWDSLIMAQISLILTSEVTKKVSHFKSCVMCHMSRVTCYLLETLTATATYHPPANSPIMHSRLVCTDQKHKKLQNPKISSKQQKKIENIYRHANISNKLFDLQLPIHREARFSHWHTDTDTQTHDSRTLQLRD